MGLRPATAFACLFDYLFRPTAKVMAMFQPQLRVLLEPSIIKIGIQVGTWLHQPPGRLLASGCSPLAACFHGNELRMLIVDTSPQRSCCSQHHCTFSAQPSPHHTTASTSIAAPGTTLSTRCLPCVCCRCAWVMVP
jgi:hypothetical protein